jgi:glycosyltransferase involved in cell wall biosynthesis
MSLPAAREARRRVLVLTKTTALGGAERLVMNALAHLDRDAFEYRFAALDDGGPLAHACTAAGFDFRALPHRGGLDPRALFSLRRRLVRERIDLVHAHLPLPGAMARLAARRLATRVVYTEHTTQDVYRRPSRWLNAASYGWQDAVVAVSARVRESAESAARRRPRMAICVVRSGVDLDALEREAAAGPRGELPPRSAGRALLLVPASLARVKGHDVLLESLALRDGPPADLWLAGDGPERSALEAQARRAGLSRDVRFLGRRSDVFALMRAADAVVLPSRREGLPLALLEAMALGRAALATRVGGVPEALRDGETGLLVPPEDPRALAHALDRLLGDPPLRARLASAAAREARLRFDVRRTVAAVERVYRRALGARGADAAQAATSASLT